jgi:hypothetical protein
MTDCEGELKARDHLILLERGASPAMAPSQTGIHSLILQHPINLMLCEQGEKVLRLDYPGSWADWGRLSLPGDMNHHGMRPRANVVHSLSSHHMFRPESKRQRLHRYLCQRLDHV